MRVVELIEREIEGTAILDLISNPHSGYVRARLVGRYEQESLHLAIGPSSNVPLELVSLLRVRNAIAYTGRVEAVFELASDGTILYRARSSHQRLPCRSTVWTLAAQAILERIGQHRQLSAVDGRSGS